MKRKTRKKKSPVDANRDHFSNARTFVQHDDVDHKSQLDDFHLRAIRIYVKDPDACPFSEETT